MIYFGVHSGDFAHVTYLRRAWPDSCETKAGQWKKATYLQKVKCWIAHVYVLIVLKEGIARLHRIYADAPEIR